MARQPLTILHLADLHLGSPVCGKTGDEALKRRLRDATFEAWDRAVDRAIEEEVDGVTIGGDCFDSGAPSLRVADRLARGLTRLEDAGIPRFLVWGNHDPEGCWPQALRPPSAHCFGSEGLEAADLFVEGQRAARIWGYSFPKAVVRESVLEGWQVPESEDVWNIGLLHTNYGGRTGHDNYCPSSAAQFDGAGVDLWLLGHVHTRDRFAGQGWTALYPGNPQGRNVRETGPKGGALVRLVPGQEPDIEWISLSGVEMLVWDLDAGGLNDLDSLEEELLRLLDGQAPSSLRLTVSGETPLAKTLDVVEGRERLASVLEALGHAVESVRFDLRAPCASVDLEGSTFLSLLDDLLTRWVEGEAPSMGSPGLWAAIGEGLDLDGDRELRAEIADRARQRILAAALPEDAS